MQSSACECVVCLLVEMDFSTLSFLDKKRIIDNGRPKPIMKNLTTKIKTCTRHFNPDKTYEQYKWLTGCDNKTKLFCWPCLLFDNEKSGWNKSGFSDLNNLHKVVKRHVTSKAHLQAVIKEKVFGKARIEHSINEQLEVSHRKHNELVGKNREVLKRLIDVVCFVGRYKFPNENSQDLVSLITKYDVGLKDHLEQSILFRGTYRDMQSNVISAVATILLNEIKTEIKQARFVSIILTETTDVTNSSQLSSVVRYLKPDGTVQQRFLSFINNIEERTAKALYKVVCETVKEIEASDKVVAQSYHGSVVMPGLLERLQAKVRETFTNALFVHCFGHKLNVVLAQSVMHIQECNLFFATLTQMADFFSKSTQRRQALDIIVQKRLPEVGAIQWDNSGQLVFTVFEYREYLIELFEQILDNSKNWDAQTLNSSRGFLDCLTREFSFVFLLYTLLEIFPCSDQVFDVLQSKISDIGLCIKTVEEFKETITQKRNDFDEVWKNTIEVINTEPERKRRHIEDSIDVQTSYRDLYYQIIDCMYQEIDIRFHDLYSLKFIGLCNFNSYKSVSFPEYFFKEVIRNYANFFDKALLHSQLTVMYETEDISAKDNTSNLLNFLKESELEDDYFEVVKLCELVLTMPLTDVSVENSFSTLERVQNVVKHSTAEDRLSQLPFLSIESKLVNQMSEHPHFYEEVMTEFSKLDTRMELHYK